MRKILFTKRSSDPVQDLEVPRLAIDVHRITAALVEDSFEGENRFLEEKEEIEDDSREVADHDIRLTHRLQTAVSSIPAEVRGIGECGLKLFHQLSFGDEGLGVRPDDDVVLPVLGEGLENRFPISGEQAVASPRWRYQHHGLLFFKPEFLFTLQRCSHHIKIGAPDLFDDLRFISPCLFKGPDPFKIPGSPYKNGIIVIHPVGLVLRSRRRVGYVAVVLDVFASLDLQDIQAGGSHHHHPGLQVTEKIIGLPGISDVLNGYRWEVGG
ncbi:MAG: hypothetical protein BWY50_02049 [Spirochaetes bacterium ADurb.Bin315]|nr:MAG: hypothetical protein BWY50_02049 [Spirochaetes bacterium ADurb.Bin315]